MQGLWAQSLPFTVSNHLRRVMGPPSTTVPEHQPPKLGARTHIMDSSGIMTLIVACNRISTGDGNISSSGQTPTVVETGWSECYGAGGNITIPD